MSEVLHRHTVLLEPRSRRPRVAVIRREDAPGQPAFYRWMAAAFAGLTALAIAGVALGLLLA
jgi:hypothetical protein